jgi:ComF family protein
MLRALLALVVPPLCAGCRGPLRGAAEVVCGACRRALPWLGDRCCPRCALPLARRHDCPAAGHAFDSAYAPVAYAGVARELVAALKFAHARPLADVMAAHLVVRVPDTAGAAIVAVPAHPARVRARGYDQAGLLAAALARRTGAPLARPLRRHGPAVRQLGASRAERLEQGRVAVTATGAAPRRVLLVDDVHTTGATLDACARALRSAGTEEVVAATWARALRPGVDRTSGGTSLTGPNQSRTIPVKGSNA